MVHTHTHTHTLIYIVPTLSFLRQDLLQIFFFLTNSGTHREGIRSRPPPSASTMLFATWTYAARPLFRAKSRPFLSTVREAFTNQCQRTCGRKLSSLLASVPYIPLLQVHFFYPFFLFFTYPSTRYILCTYMCTECVGL